jgi:hypothetical protein
MDVSRTWVAIGTVAVLGLGGTATAALALDDRAPLPAGSAVELVPAPDGGATDGTGRVDADTPDVSPESADSPDASAVDSAGSAADAPDRSDDSPGDRDPVLDTDQASTADGPRQDGPLQGRR